MSFACCAVHLNKLTPAYSSEDEQIKTKNALQALLNSCVQAKFLFCAAYSTRIVPFYPLKYVLELKTISSYATLPTFMLGAPTFETYFFSLPFCHLDTPG